MVMVMMIIGGYSACARGGVSKNQPKNTTLVSAEICMGSAGIVFRFFADFPEHAQSENIDFE